MSDRSGRRRVLGGDTLRSEGLTGVERRDEAISSDRDVPTYNTWVTFYGRLDDQTPDEYRSAVFGGTGLVGAGVLLLEFYARVGDSFALVEASARALVAGFVLLTFGSGYYIVRARSTCSECETIFSRRRTEVRQIRRGTDDEGPDKVYLEETFECEACGDRTTEPSTYSQQMYLQY